MQASRLERAAVCPGRHAEFAWKRGRERPRTNTQPFDFESRRKVDPARRGRNPAYRFIFQIDERLCYNYGSESALDPKPTDPEEP